MESSQILAGRDHLTDHTTLTRDEVDNAIRQTCLLEHLHQEVVGVQSRRRGFPDSNVTHHSGCHVQVRGDRGEVERCQGEDEALQRTILHAVQDTRIRIGLIGIDLAGIEGAETQEVDQFARCVDLGLEGVLTLTQHHGCVQDIAIFRSQQLCHTQHDGSTLYPRQLRPLLMCLHRSVNRHLHLLLACLVVGSQYMVMIMRHHHLTGVTGADLLTANDQRYLPFFRTQLLQGLLQRGFLR